MRKSKTFSFAGKEITMETGKLANQADGAITLHCGGTTVLVTVVASDQPRPGIDFFPLTVDVEERMYAAGKIPGSFFRREGRPGEKAILQARLIDRPLRPMFADGFRNDVQVIATILSVDLVNPPDTLMIFGASAALALTDIPFEGPIGAVRVGCVDGQYIVNPTFQEIERGTLDLVMAGKDSSIVMVEAGSAEVTEEEIVAAFRHGTAAIDQLVAQQIAFRDEYFAELAAAGVARKVRSFPIDKGDVELEEKVRSLAGDKIAQAVRIGKKEERSAATKAVAAEVNQALADSYPEAGAAISKFLKKVEKAAMRGMILQEGRRPDGRSPSDIRPIGDDDHPVEVGILARAHGTGLFTRGETQVLSILTLGSTREEQRLDGLDIDTTKRYLHHYNFPPFSTGEVGRMTGPRRREIGHGALAERALLPVIPGEDTFPYTIRIVSECLSSNGSTSMASVCGSTLALMDAGVPIKAPVAGVAMGLITDKSAPGSKPVVLTDILGMEDALGDMDFKVAGTSKGITALQMDMKITGISLEVLEHALSEAKAGRLHILGKIVAAIPESRSELSPYAPRVLSLKVDTEKIGMIIGPGGKMIRAIQDDTAAQISIEDDGTVFIHSKDAEGGMRAKQTIESMIREPQIGDVYLGKVVKTVPFGAFVQLAPGRDGLVHISKLGEGHIHAVEDVVNNGDEILVEIAEIDRMGRINLLVRELHPGAEAAKEVTGVGQA